MTRSSAARNTCSRRSSTKPSRPNSFTAPYGLFLHISAEFRPTQLHMKETLQARERLTHLYNQKALRYGIVFDELVRQVAVHSMDLATLVGKVGLSIPFPSENQHLIPPMVTLSITNNGHEPQAAIHLVLDSSNSRQLILDHQNEWMGFALDKHSHQTLERYDGTYPSIQGLRTSDERSVETRVLRLPPYQVFLKQHIQHGITAVPQQLPHQQITFGL